MNNMKFNNQTSFYVMVATNRISAFDVILPREIPYNLEVSKIL